MKNILKLVTSVVAPQQIKTWNLLVALLLSFIMVGGVFLFNSRKTPQNIFETMVRKNLEIKTMKQTASFNDDSGGIINKLDLDLRSDLRDPANPKSKLTQVTTIQNDEDEVTSKTDLMAVDDRYYARYDVELYGVGVGQWTEIPNCSEQLSEDVGACIIDLVNTVLGEMPMGYFGAYAGQASKLILAAYKVDYDDVARVTLDGQQTMRFNVDYDASALKDANSQIFDHFDMDQKQALGKDDLDEDGSFTVWINTDTYRPVKISYLDEEGDATETLLSDFNRQPVVEAPDVPSDSLARFNDNMRDANNLASIELIKVGLIAYREETGRLPSSQDEIEQFYTDRMESAISYDRQKEYLMSYDVAGADSEDETFLNTISYVPGARCGEGGTYWYPYDSTYYFALFVLVSDSDYPVCIDNY